MMRYILLALFAVGAAAALGKVFIWGEAVTNYGAYVPWGLWVGLYILLVGAAAGAAWIGAAYLMRQGEEARREADFAFMVAGVSLAAGLAFIGSDLGKPLKGIAIMMSPTFSSKLAIAAWTYGVFFLGVGGYFLTTAKKPFALLAAAAGIVFVAAEGLFFGGMIAREYWQGLLTPLSFFVSGAAAGAALFIMFGALSGYVQRERGAYMARLLLRLLATQLVIEVIHGGLMLAAGGDKAAGAAAVWTAWPFLLLYLLLGTLVPLWMLRQHSQGLPSMPAVLAFIGLVAYKVSFVRHGGFATAPLPGLPGAFQHSRLSLNYTPSLVEWLIAIGFLAGMAWAILVLADQMKKRIRLNGKGGAQDEA